MDFNLNHLLAASCSNPDVAFDVTKSLKENQEASQGWNVYAIELCCVMYKITAKIVEEGIWNEEAEKWDKPPTFEIRSVTTE